MQGRKVQEECIKIRDPKRIGQVLDALGAVWMKSPDLRFGQLMERLFNKKDIFYVEDDDIILHLRDLTRTKTIAVEFKAIAPEDDFTGESTPEVLVEFLRHIQQKGYVIYIVDPRAGAPARKSEIQAFMSRIKVPVALVSNAFPEVDAFIGKGSLCVDNLFGGVDEDYTPSLAGAVESLESFLEYLTERDSMICALKTAAQEHAKAQDECSIYCETCGKDMHRQKFSSEKSLEIFMKAGICQQCQNAGVKPKVR